LSAWVSGADAGLLTAVHGRVSIAIGPAREAALAN
jgi:hypothetical protein